MTDAAATLATFSDFRLVKGRKVAQLVFEIPIEQADAALNALGGLPQPAQETWCGIARVNHKAAPEPPKERRRWDELSYAEQAGIRCNEPQFQRFCLDLGYKGEANAETAANIVRTECYVNSRSELDTAPGSRGCWETMQLRYQEWLRSNPF